MRQTKGFGQRPFYTLLWFSFYTLLWYFVLHFTVVPRSTFCCGTSFQVLHFAVVPRSTLCCGTLVPRSTLAVILWYLVLHLLWYCGNSYYTLLWYWGTSLYTLLWYLVLHFAVVLWYLVLHFAVVLWYLVLHFAVVLWYLVLHFAVVPRSAPPFLPSTAVGYGQCPVTLTRHEMN